MKQSTLAIIVVVLLLPVIALIVHLEGKKSANPTNTSADATPTPDANNQTVTDASKLVDPSDAVSAHKVILKTTKGDITINLFPEDAPKTVENFVTLGSRGYYTNKVYFHRILQSFVIQAGDPTGTGSGGESIFGAKFPDEINSHKIVQGTLAMANAGPNTNGSQFFIVTQTAQPSLDGSYTVFGQIDPASQSVVDAIAAVKVNDPSVGTPVDPSEVTITGFEIVDK
jgi:cyclophilin family peptidyl-prolyl cis-trans isomerase